jgi:hypothetical protein
MRCRRACPAPLLVRCVTEHEYGERGSAAGDREMGGKTVNGWREGKHRGQRDGREDSVALYPAGKAFPENRVRTEKQIGEERSREAKEEIIAVFTVYRGFISFCFFRGDVARPSLLL